ncbi:hypothetical protein MA16_Dca004908 [Dendrobium catenatum]|uniref:Uncharacterized protein n=1 Tax=Dendrobium catenatum TaxID=906689 RepID=A0A2I0WGC5_9ASPA|nr:hypothetical protein MA16_Dca004908 [Dendrobium catenatum]
MSTSFGLVERQAVNSSAVFLIHGSKVDSSGPEASNTVSGKKRSNSDSAYMGFITEKNRRVCADAAECSRSVKVTVNIAVEFVLLFHNVQCFSTQASYNF